MVGDGTKKTASVTRMKGRNGKFQKARGSEKKQGPICKRRRNHTFKSTDLPIMMRARGEDER
jgi:hypothetical protein